MGTKTPSYRIKAKIAARALGGESLEEISADTSHDKAEIAAWKESFVAGGIERIQRDFPPRSQQPSFPRPNPSMSSVGEALEDARPKLDCVPGCGVGGSCDPVVGC